jgi:hypothetical protein
VNILGVQSGLYGEYTKLLKMIRKREDKDGLDLLRWSGYKLTNVWAGPDPDHEPPAATDPVPDQVSCTDLPKAIRRCGLDTDSEPLITSGSDPGPGAVLNKDLYFFSDPYSGCTANLGHIRTE